MQIDFPPLPDDPANPYVRPTPTECEWVKSYPIGDFGISLDAGLTNEFGETPFGEFTVTIGSSHGADGWNEFIPVKVRDLVDDAFDFYYSGTTIHPGDAIHLQKLAEHFEAEAAYIREKLAAAAPMVKANG